MATTHHLLVWLLVLPGICLGVGRVKERIYVMLTDNHQCFRILNGTKQVGCQSNRDGSSGILHYVQNDADVDYVLRDPGGHSPFIVAMRLELFRNVSLVRGLHDSGKLNGMLLIHTAEDNDEPFSEDSQCPNEFSSLYKTDPAYGSCSKQLWNEHGTGLRWMDFNMPLFLINNKTEIEILIDKCYRGHNQPDAGQPPQYPLCAVQMFMFNSAAGSAIRCLRRNKLITGLDNPTLNCDPIGDYNVFSFIPPTNKSIPLNNDSVLVLAARMDSFSLFSDYDPGAETSLSNVVAMLAIIEALGRNKEFIKNSSLTTNKYLMPVFFNGESLDYIGSSRMVWEMSNGNFPSPLTENVEDQAALVSMSNLALILEFNQLSSSGGYFLHTDPISLSNPGTNATVTNVSNLLASYSSKAIRPIADLSAPLPPSSVQSFLLVHRSIPALVITDHEKTFSNRYYNSFTDVPSHINRHKVLPKLTNLTDSVLKFVFEWVSDGKTPSNWRVDQSVVEEIADCLWDWPKWNCAIFDRLDASFSKSVPYKRTYIGPFQGLRKWAPLRTFIDYVTSYFVGDRHLMPNDTSKCEPSAFSNRTGTMYTYKVMMDLFDNSSDAKYCVVSTVDLSEAVSPAFKIQGYDFTSGTYSTWVESRWENPALRVFLKASQLWEISVLVVGVLVVLVSLVVVHLVSRGSDVLFASQQPTPL